MNQVILMGRLTKDVEVKEAKTSVARFSIAVNRQFKKEGEERQADFINCVAFGHTANHIAKYYAKGSMIAITGRMQTGSYDKDGQKVYTTDVIVDNSFFCGSKSEKNDAGVQSTPAFTVVEDDENLPF